MDRPENHYRYAALLVIDTRAIFHSCNDTFLEISGYTREEITGRSLFDLLHIHDTEHVQRVFAATDQFPENCGTVTFQDKQGNSLPYFFSSCNLPVCSAGRLVAISLYDISREDRLRRSLAATQKTLERTITAHDRKLHEYTASLIETNVDLRKKVREHGLAAEALKASESRFRNLTETTSDFIWEIDRNACYTYASPKVAKLLGLHP